MIIPRLIGCQKELVFISELRSRLFGLSARLGDVDCLARRDLVSEAPVSIGGISSNTLEFAGAYTHRHSTLVNGVSRIGRFCSIAHSVGFGEFEHPTDWLTTSSTAFHADSWQFRRPPVGGRYAAQPPGIVIGNDI